MSRLSLPAGLERWWVAGAMLVWVGVVVGGALPRMATAVAAAALTVAWVPLWRIEPRAALAAMVVVIGFGAGWAAGFGGPTEVPDLSGPVVLVGDVVSDSRPGRFGSWLLVRPVGVQVGDRIVPWRGPVGLVAFGEETDWRVGSRLQLSGVVVATPGSAAGDAYSWRMRPDSATAVPVAAPWLIRVADVVRGRISASLEGAGARSAAALVSGFLIGDVRELADVDQEAMRGAGLSHFVAVSGSNVALFLIVWWVVLGPLAPSPAVRALGGLIGLALFGMITRWEPSVVRASAMAGAVLVGRAAGMPITVWTALGWATSLVLVVEPAYATDVGFQLSVAATAGVLVGARMLAGLGPRWLTLPLGVTLAAQAAVAPILLVVFGELPIWSPLANLLAAPLVTVATALGGFGALGVGPATDLAVRVAGIVLRIAHAVAGLPTVGWAGFTGIAAALGVGVRFRRLRPVLVLGAAVVVGSGLLPTSGVSGPAVLALDVGQGDAVVLVGDGGGVVLVDGGPDPVAINRALSRNGIRRIDLAIATHPDDDHIAGIIEVVGRLPVGQVWRPDLAGGHPRIVELDAVAAAHAVEVRAPQVGDVVDVGGVRLDVLGPLRRYAAVNDQSIVMVAAVGALTIYLTADTEATAQRELGMPSADVLKVPHHGSNTTDLDWLASTDAEVAIISVGANDFGHPTSEVLTVLEQLGMEVRRTDLEGDIVIRP